MSWNDADNKHYRGHIDRIYVSESESYEVGYFIRHFLTHFGKDVSEQNKALVGKAMEQYPGKAPVYRDALMAFLKKHFNL